MSIEPPSAPQPPVVTPVDGDDKEAASTAKSGAAIGPAAPPAKVREIGGPPGPEPTRYGDWQFNGRVTDF